MLASGWIHHIVDARGCFAVVDKLFKHAQSGSSIVRRIPYHILDELIALALLGPSMRTHLDSPIADVAYASDATLTRGCFVETDLDIADQVFLWQRWPRRGGSLPVFFDGDVDAADAEAFVDVNASDELLYEWVDSAPWRAVTAWDFARKAHITMQEAAAARTVKKRGARGGRLWSKKVIVFVDNKPLRGASTRGRSSSWRLNRVLRGDIPYTVPTRMQWCFFWVPSKRNPSDDGTRHHALRAPLARTARLEQRLATIQEECPRPAFVCRSHASGLVEANGSGDTPSVKVPPEPAQGAKHLRHLRRSWKRAQKRLDARGVSVVREKPLLIDICAGKRSPLSQAGVAAGWEVAVFDVLLDKNAGDILQPHVRERIRSLIRQGRRRKVVVALGPPCRTFGTLWLARDICSRTRKRPFGGGKGLRLHPLERLGNALWTACCEIADEADDEDVDWILEHPKASAAWKSRRWRTTYEKSGRRRDQAAVDWCRYERGWRKSTLFRGRAEWLKELEATCTRDHEHIILQGRIKDEDGSWKQATELAGEYSQSFCRRYIRAAGRCARTSARYGLRAQRIGEASHPGPGWLIFMRWLGLHLCASLVAGPPAARPIDLRDGIEPTTLVRYGASLTGFDEWAARNKMPRHALLAELASRSVNAVLVARMQAAAADRRGPSDGSYLLAAFQHEYPHLRGLLKESWHALGVWKRKTPTSSRVPCDEHVLQACVVVALSWGWPLTALALTMGFYGLLRPAEIVHLRIRHLVLPIRQVKWAARSVVVSIVKPKTRYRAARIQGTVILTAIAVVVAEKLAGMFSGATALASDGAVGLNRRFSALLTSIGCNVHYSLASLRGGGAIAALQTGKFGLAELMFRGRWEQAATMHHYLQETLAASAAGQLTRESQNRIEMLCVLLAEWAY
jgi:hypothetical protein